MLLDDLRYHLIAGSIGTTEVYCGSFPSHSADTAVVILETGGLESVHTMSTGVGNAVLEQPRVQVVVRSSAYETARAVMEETHHWLDGLRDIEISSVKYSWVEAVQQPFFLRRDENRRFEIACNYQIVREKHATATSTSGSYEWIQLNWAQ